MDAVTPLPTPYDILDVPYVPWEPGLSAWFVLTALVALIAAASFLLQRRQRSHLAPLAELGELRTNTAMPPRIKAERASILARAVLSDRAPDARHAPAAELSELSAEAPELVRALERIEMFRYGKNQSPAVLDDSIAALLSALSAFLSARRDV